MAATIASAGFVPTTPERSAMPAVEEAVVVLAAHGSRAEAGNDAHRALAAQLAERSGRTVLAAFLELAEPSIGDTIDRAAPRARAVVVLPYFLHPGRHVDEDIPAIVEDARSRHPGVEITLLAAFGSTDEVLDLLTVQLRDA